MGNTTKDRVIKRNELLIICTGYYSDYCIRAVVKALVDFTPKEVIEKYLNCSKNQMDYPESWSRFIGWLVENNYIEALDYREWHIGEFGELKSAI